MLGNGEYELRFVSNVDGRVFRTTEYVTLSYEFGQNKTQPGSVTLPDSCCDGTIDVLSHECEIWRDSRREWTGVVTSMRSTRGSVQYTLQDLSFWTGRRLIHVEHDYSFVNAHKDASDVFAELVEDGMSVDPKNFRVSASASGVAFSKKIEKYAQLSDVMRDLSVWCDWQMKDRVLRVGGPELSGLKRIKLSDDDWGDPQSIDVVRDGNSLATRLVMTGVFFGTTDENLASGTFIRDSTTGGGKYGLHEQIYTDNSLVRKTQLDRAYAQRLAHLSELDVYVESTGPLSHTSALNFSDLIPGARAYVLLTSSCVPVNEWLRLASVRVSSDADKVENIQVDFEPLGVTVDTEGNVEYDFADGAGEVATNA